MLKRTKSITEPTPTAESSTKLLLAIAISNKRKNPNLWIQTEPKNRNKSSTKKGNTFIAALSKHPLQDLQTDGVVIHDKDPQTGRVERCIAAVPIGGGARHRRRCPHTSVIHTQQTQQPDPTAKSPQFFQNPAPQLTSDGELVENWRKRR